MVVDYHKSETVFINDTNHRTYDGSPISKIILVDASRNYALHSITFKNGMVADKPEIGMDGHYLAVRHLGLSPFSTGSRQIKFQDNMSITLSLSLQHARSKEWVLVAALLEGDVTAAVENLSWSDINELVDLL